VQSDTAATTAEARQLRRQQRTEIGRTQILDAAEDLFASHGYTATRLEAIAVRSGFSVGGLYIFFDSKESVYAQVLARRGAVMQERMAACRDLPVDGMQKLLRMVAAVVDTLREFPAYGRVVLQAVTSQAPPADGGQFADGLARYAEAIDQGQREALIRTGEASRLAVLVAGLVMAHSRIDPVIAQDSDGIGRDELLDIVRCALAAPTAAVPDSARPAG
jgi:TetR/AcrR family transcriptional regulator of autoinduction and epiphytic fitness